MNGLLLADALPLTGALAGTPAVGPLGKKGGVTGPVIGPTAGFPLLDVATDWSN